jgi:hypothetical protein
MMGNGKLFFSSFFFWFSFQGGSARATGGTVCTGTLTFKTQTDGGYKTSSRQLDWISTLTGFVGSPII